MATAIAVWRLYPTQIESGLSAFHDRKIREWLADDFTMSSRELLGLIEELPESSEFKKARDRTFRVCERDGTLVLFPIIADVPDNATVVAEYVDWTYDRKLAARNVRETAALRADGKDYDPDFEGLMEPLQQVLIERAKQVRAENSRGAKSFIRRRLFGGKAVT